jgi:hypothetical protein
MEMDGVKEVSYNPVDQSAFISGAATASSSMFPQAADNGAFFQADVAKSPSIC